MTKRWGVRKRFQAPLQFLACPSSPAQRSILSPLRTHSPLSWPASVNLVPQKFEQAFGDLDQDWPASPGLGRRPGLGTGGRSGTPVAHEARGWGWGWGFWSAALQGCLLGRNEPGHGSASHAEGQNGTAGEEPKIWNEDSGAEGNCPL